MHTAELKRFLERLVIDRAFLAAFQSDPAKATAPFDLTDRQRALLVAGGDGARILLAEAFAEASGIDTPADPDAAPPTPPPAPLPVPSPAAGSSGGQVRLLVRLMFGVDGADAGQAQLHYAATLHVLPPDADPAAVPSPDLAPGVLPGDRVTDALFELKVVPHLTQTEAGGYHVTCLHAATPVRSGPVADTPTVAPAIETGPAATDLQPLLEAVRTAPQAGRQDALRALVAAVDTDTPHG